MVWRRLATTTTCWRGAAFSESIEDVRVEFVRGLRILAAMNGATSIRYVAWASEGGKHYSDELAETEFRSAVEAGDTIAHYTEVEEVFRAFLDNYGELEIALLSLAQENILLGHVGYGRAMHHRLLLDRRYANLLSSARLYLDYALSSRVCGAASVSRERVDAVRKAQYDAALGYRVMEALRNYIQHRGFPLEGLTYQRSAIGELEAGVSQTYIVPALALERIRKDKCFKAEVLAEMEALGVHSDLRQWTREYVDGLRHVHVAVIAEVGGGVDMAIGSYMKVCRRFAERIASEDLIVRYELRDDGNRVLERHAFTREIVEHTTAMRLANRYRGDIGKQFVTNFLREQ